MKKSRVCNETVAEGIRALRFGVEVEMEFAKRDSANIMAEVTGGKITKPIYKDDISREINKRVYNIIAPDGRTWGIDDDVSIASAWGQDFNSEMVSPILHHEDMGTLAALLKKFQSNGATATKKCALHVNIDGATFNNESIKRLLTNFHNNQDLYFAITQHKNPDLLVRRVSPLHPHNIANMQQAQDTHELEHAWYGPHYDGKGRNHRDHYYNMSRYQAINLHSYFRQSRIEFRPANTPEDLCPDTSRALIDLWRGMSAASTHGIELPPVKNSKQFNKSLKNMGLVGADFTSSREILVERYANR